MNPVKGLSFLKAIKLPWRLIIREKSSHDWLERQLKDPYVEKAKMENYRCRSAFKLLEIDAKHNILEPGQCVVDCGAAPGSWTQVAVQKTNALGKDRLKPQGAIFSIDKSHIYPIEGATVLGPCDFTKIETQERLKEALKGRGVDLVMSDMAPNATGVKFMDHDLIIGLAYSVIRFALQVSGNGAKLVVKLWDGNSTCAVEKDLSRFYDSVKRVKPPASRSDSSELFLLAKGFKGVEK